MNTVQIDQTTYQMPPREGISIAHFLTVANIERSARYYEKVFDGRILSTGDTNGAPVIPTDSQHLAAGKLRRRPHTRQAHRNPQHPLNPDHINSFMNIRVADIQACYELWKAVVLKSEGITPPIPKYGEIRCYIRDPDGYIIQVGQSTDLVYG